jgi:ubiquitin carboxyl-terminal hydrolase 10
VKANTPKQANGIITPLKAKAHPNGHFGSLAEALTAFRIEQDDQISTPFLEPRGLVNTGNMCFMNSVSISQSRHALGTNVQKQILQILVFCGPFYFFLDRIGSGAVRSFKDDTPLLEAMSVAPLSLSYPS